ncbi:MAG: hypothetical protein R2879_19685 [Saprospiraceae bacterium]
MVKSFRINANQTFRLQPGFWIINVKAEDGQKSVKVITN